MSLIRFLFEMSSSVFEDKVMIFRMALFPFILLLFSLASGIHSETILYKEDRPVPSFYAFGEELNAEEIATWYELEKIAAAENRIVLPDCATAGLQDHIARWIPESGLEFTLRPQQNRRVFLYLDFVGMIDQNLESIADEQRCRPARRETMLPSNRRGPYEWLEISVNGKRKLIVYQGHDIGFTGPIAVPVSRDEFQSGLIHVRIVPSGRLFALWDVFLSHSPPEE
jgi:hypothetical protein